MGFSWRLVDKTTGGTDRPFYAILSGKSDRSPAVVTTRLGSFGDSGRREANVSFKVGDDPDNVRENRQVLMRTFKLREDKLALPEQVHGGLVLAADGPGDYKGADGLVISGPGVWTSVLVADCVPVFVFNADFSAVGLAHAGRRGTQAGITRNLIRQIRSAFRLAPGQLVLALGPSIGPCCYDLDLATASMLSPKFVAQKEGRPFFDLWSANASQALEEGVPEENIVLPPACTCCEKTVFFSHRADRGRTGRQMAITRPGGLELSRGSYACVRE